MMLYENDLRAAKAATSQLHLINTYFWDKFRTEQSNNTKL